MSTIVLATFRASSRHPSSALVAAPTTARSNAGSLSGSLLASRPGESASSDALVAASLAAETSTAWILWMHVSTGCSTIASASPTSFLSPNSGETK